MRRSTGPRFCAIGLAGSALTFPTERLYMCLVRKFVYLKRTRKLGIRYSAHPPETSTVHAAHARRLQLGGAAVDDRVRHLPRRRGHQLRVAQAALHLALSSCEAELIALADVAIELVHTDRMLEPWLEHIGHRRSGPIAVGTDNRARTTCATDSPPRRTRDTSTASCSSCVRCAAAAGTCTVELVLTEVNPADIFTKVLSRQ
eukprot:5982295-Prymnesium_polylepis.1